MKRRHGALAALAAGTGTVALANAALRRRSPPLEPALDGEQRTFEWRGFDVRYAEAGDPADPDLVLLHGVNAVASNGEFRAVFDDLATDYHVIAPDLPGFGTSDRPPLRYSATLYTEFVRDFLSVVPEQPSVVASSLTAAYLAEVSERHSAACRTESGTVADDLDLSNVVLVCPTDRVGPDRNVLVRELLRAPLVGEALFNVIASKPSIRHFNADHGYYDPDRVSEEWTEYEWQTAHQPNARYAPASFVSGFLNADRDLEATLPGVDAPVTLVWGREADVTPLKRGRELAELADCRLVVVDGAKLLPHAEFPEQFAGVVRDALAIGA